jgi:tetratricopeptide (TPR) repeat protein
MWQGAFDQSQVAFDRALAAAERLGDPDQIAHYRSQRGMPAFFAGSWEQARADFGQGLALTRQVGASSKLVYALEWYGELAFRMGDWDTALHCVEEGIVLAAHNEERQGLRRMQTLLAEYDLREGQPQAARARLMPLLDRPGMEEHDVTWLLPTLAWAYLDLGDVASAVEMAGQAAQRARAQAHRLALVDALWVQAMVAIRQQHWDEATRALEEGLTLAREMPYPYAEGRLLHVSGEMHVQKGEPDLAQERLAAALAIFWRLGARKDSERVEHAIAVL